MRTCDRALSVACILVCLFLVRSGQAAVAPLTLTSPSGGEVYTIGMEQEIKVGKILKAPEVKISLRRASGPFVVIGVIKKTDKNQGFHNTDRVNYLILNPPTP